MNVLTTTIQLGWLALREDKFDDAESHFQDLVEMEARWGGNNSSPALLGLGLLELRRGDPERARAIFRQALVQLWEHASRSTPLADALVYIASVDGVDGLHERAQRLLGAAEGWHAARGALSQRWRPNVRAPVLQRLVPVPQVPVDPILVKARLEGRAMSLEEAVAYALDPLSDVTGLRPVAVRA